MPYCGPNRSAVIEKRFFPNGTSMSTLVGYRVFVTIVEQQSFSGAAKELHLSASTVSKQLSKLEDRLGAQLIDRSTTTLSITQSGLNFYEQCKDILQRVDQAEISLAQEQQDLGGCISVSFSSVLCKSVLIEVLTEFADEYPHITLNLQTEDQYENLVANNIDFSFRIGEVINSLMVCLPLLKTRMVMAAAPSYLQKRGNPEKTGLWKNHKLIIPSYFPEKEVTQFLNLTNDSDCQNIKNHHKTNDVLCLIEAGISGLGIITSLDLSLNKAIAKGELEVLFPEMNMPSRPLNLIYHKRSYMPNYMCVFKDFIKTHTLLN